MQEREHRERVPPRIAADPAVCVLKREEAADSAFDRAVDLLVEGVLSRQAAAADEKGKDGDRRGASLHALAIRN